MKQKIKHVAVMLPASVILGALLLTIVFCIPVDRMRRNVEKSVGCMVLREEEVSKDAFSQYIWRNRETYTDVIMTQNAIEQIEGKNVYEHAMWVYHTDIEPEFWDPEESLRAYFNADNDKTMHLHEYSRYWHGYLVYLKPLLLLFSWEQIVWLGIILQIGLMLCVTALAVKKKRTRVAVMAGIGFLFMKPILVLVSLTMSVCWVICLLTLLIMLAYHEKIKGKNYYPELFLVAGIVTAYFDFLTYPVVTLGIPLCAYFLMEKQEKLVTGIRSAVEYSIYWGIGYVGMWASKWVLADLTLHTGTIKDAVWSIIGRTEAIGGRPRLNGGWYVIGLNLQEYPQLFTYVAILLVLFVTALLVISILKSRGEMKLKSLVPYGIIFCIPFVWIIVVQHHSALHARFTFRIIGIAVAAIACMGIEAYCAIKSAKKAGKS